MNISAKHSVVNVGHIEFRISDIASILEAFYSTQATIIYQ